jgi:hypothetical protein
MSDEQPQVEPHRTPRWVILAAVATAIVILIVIAVMVLGGGDHGPSRHGPQHGSVGAQRVQL